MGDAYEAMEAMSPTRPAQRIASLETDLLTKEEQIGGLTSELERARWQADMNETHGRNLKHENCALKQQLAASQAETRQVMDDYQDMGEEMGKLQAEAAALRGELQKIAVFGTTDARMDRPSSPRDISEVKRIAARALTSPSAAAERVRLLEGVAKWAKANIDAKTARTNYILLHGNAPREMLAKIFEADGKLRAALAALDAAAERVQVLEREHALAVLVHWFVYNTGHYDNWVASIRAVEGVEHLTQEIVDKAIAALDAATAKEAATVEEVKGDD